MTSETPWAEPALLKTLWLPAPGGHTLHVQEYGAADGQPVLLLHGGPGSGQSPVLRRAFDGRRYRLICMDQRGSGHSKPAGSVEHNTTADLLDDIVQLRQHLGLQRWLVCGGSWGATLAVAYAAAEPAAVQALLLRSSFLARRADVDVFFEGSAAHAPAAWDHFVSMLPPGRPGPVLETLAAVFAQGDRAAIERAAQGWWVWERALASGRHATAVPQGDALAACVQRYAVQIHYLAHDCFLTTPPLLDRCARIPAVPTLILHARDDLICPPAGAAALNARLPGSQLQWLDLGGHDPSHPAMLAATRRALHNLALHGLFASPP